MVALNEATSIPLGNAASGWLRTASIALTTELMASTAWGSVTVSGSERSNAISFDPAVAMSDSGFGIDAGVQPSSASNDVSASSSPLAATSGSSATTNSSTR